jgi:PAS domain S-box-containing protein
MMSAQQRALVDAFCWDWFGFADDGSTVEGAIRCIERCWAAVLRGRSAAEIPPLERELFLGLQAILRASYLPLHQLFDCRIWTNDNALREALLKAGEKLWVCGVDPDRNFGISQGLADYTGSRQEEWEGAGWLDRVHPDDRQRVLDNCRRAFAACQPFGIRYRLRRAGGRYGWVLDHGEPRFHEDGSFAGFVGMVHEVAMPRHAESDRSVDITAGSPLRARTAEVIGVNGWRESRKLHLSNTA